MLFDYVMLYVPTWLYTRSATYFDPNKNVEFSVSPGVIGAISVIIIEYIISVYPLLRHHRVGKNIRFTQYFIHEIIFLID